MSSDQPKVSLITVNYNGTQVTTEFLKSISGLTYRNIEIIVVDNASNFDPTEEIKKVQPAAKVIRSERNLGFAGGNNLGIKNASGDYYFFVNNDTELTPNIIEPLLETFKTYPDAGVVCPKFRYFFNPDIIEYAGYEKVHPWNGRNKMIGCKEPDDGQYDSVYETNYAHGGGMLVSANVVKIVGLMPEQYFLYYEEFDWCEQIKRKGYKIYYQYKSIIYHKESMTTGKNSKLKTYYLIRNRILFIRRNGKRLSKLAFATYLILFTVPKNSAAYILSKQPEHLKAFWKGIWWNITNSKN